MSPTEIFNQQIAHWREALPEIIDKGGYPAGTSLKSGAVVAANTTTATVWDMAGVAVKVFRRSDYARACMARETALVAHLQKQGKNDVLPFLHCYAPLKDNNDGKGRDGIAVYERVPGRALSFREIESLPADQYASWMWAAARQMVIFENALAAVAPVPHVQPGYAEQSLAWLRRGATSNPVSPDDIALAEDITAMIKSETWGRRGHQAHGNLK